QRQQMIFERNARYGQPDTFDRAGMCILLGDGAFEVVDVIAGGAAHAAGVKAGDRILRVDGKGAGELKLSALRKALRARPPGTRVQLLVESGGKRREVELALRELVP